MFPESPGYQIPLRHSISYTKLNAPNPYHARRLVSQGGHFQTKEDGLPVTAILILPLGPAISPCGQDISWLIASTRCIEKSLNINLTMPLLPLSASSCLATVQHDQTRHHDMIASRPSRWVQALAGTAHKMIVMQHYTDCHLTFVFLRPMWQSTSSVLYHQSLVEI